MKWRLGQCSCRIHLGWTLGHCNGGHQARLGGLLEPHRGWAWLGWVLEDFCFHKGLSLGLVGSMKNVGIPFCLWCSRGSCLVGSGSHLLGLDRVSFYVDKVGTSDHSCQQAWVALCLWTHRTPKSNGDSLVWQEGDAGASRGTRSLWSAQGLLRGQLVGISSQAVSRRELGLLTHHDGWCRKAPAVF